MQVGRELFALVAVLAVTASCSQKETVTETGRPTALSEIDHQETTGSDDYRWVRLRPIDAPPPSENDQPYDEDELISIEGELLIRPGAMASVKNAGCEAMPVDADIVRYRPNMFRLTIQTGTLTSRKDLYIKTGRWDPESAGGFVATLNFLQDNDEEKIIAQISDDVGDGERVHVAIGGALPEMDYCRVSFSMKYNQ